MQTPPNLGLGFLGINIDRWCKIWTVEGRVLLPPPLPPPSRLIYSLSVHRISRIVLEASCLWISGFFLICTSGCYDSSLVLVAACFVCKFDGLYFNCSSCVYDLVAMVHKKSNGGSARVREGRMGSWTDDFYICVNNQSLALHCLLQFCFRWGCCRCSGSWGEVWSFLSLFLVRCCLMVVSSDVSIHQYKKPVLLLTFHERETGIYLSSLSLQILSQFSVQIITKIVVLF